MASDCLIRGFFLRHGIAKSIHKGEDAVAVFETAIDEAESNDAVEKSSLFAVFDGHGGKQAATFASKTLSNELNNRLPSGVSAGGFDIDMYSSLPLDYHMKQQCAKVDTAAKQLPQVLKDSFLAIDSECKRRYKTSGTTATVAAFVGWDLVVANVGDSCAFLDTGNEIIHMTTSHRLDDNQQEQERCKQAGAELAQATADSEPVGPLRVWPGGLAMARTLGDTGAGDVVTAEPDVKQVTIPPQGGRLIIASDGLWDALSGKAAAHHVRGMTATKAAHDLMKAALKSHGLRDDISIIVVDAIPDNTSRYPPCISKSASTNSASQSHGLVVWKPLEARKDSAAAVWLKRVNEQRLALLSLGTLSARTVLGSDSKDNSPSPTDSPMSTHSSNLSVPSASTNTDNSSLFDELANLRVDVDELMEAALPASDAGDASMQQAEADDGEWETVRSKHAHAQPPPAVPGSHQRRDFRRDPRQQRRQQPHHLQASEFRERRPRAHAADSQGIVGTEGQAAESRERRPRARTADGQDVAAGDAQPAYNQRRERNFAQQQEQGRGRGSVRGYRGRGRGRGRGGRRNQSDNDNMAHGRPQMVSEVTDPGHASIDGANAVGLENGGSVKQDMYQMRPQGQDDANGGRSIAQRQHARAYTDQAQQEGGQSQRAAAEPHVKYNVVYDDARQYPPHRGRGRLGRGRGAGFGRQGGRHSHAGPQRSFDQNRPAQSPDNE